MEKLGMAQFYFILSIWASISKYKHWNYIKIFANINWASLPALAEFSWSHATDHAPGQLEGRLALTAPLGHVPSSVWGPCWENGADSAPCCLSSSSRLAWAWSHGKSQGLQRWAETCKVSWGGGWGKPPCIPSATLYESRKAMGPVLVIGAGE